MSFKNSTFINTFVHCLSFETVQRSPNSACFPRTSQRFIRLVLSDKVLQVFKEGRENPCSNVAPYNVSLKKVM